MSILFESGKYILNITFMRGHIVGLIRIPSEDFSKEFVLDFSIFSLVFRAEMSFVMSLILCINTF